MPCETVLLFHFVLATKQLAPDISSILLIFVKKKSLAMECYGLSHMFDILHRFIFLVKEM